MAQNTTTTELKETVIHINRVAKVVKGGRRFSFNCISTVGDGDGKVGIGFGKANEVTDAIRKSLDAARKNMITIPLAGDGTIPHSVTGKIAGAKIFMRPASSGTGIIAGGPVRAVLEVAGVRNVLSKSLGSNNAINMVKATMRGLESLRSAEDVAELRGKSIAEFKKW